MRLSEYKKLLDTKDEDEKENLTNKLYASVELHYSRFSSLGIKDFELLSLHPSFIVVKYGDKKNKRIQTISVWALVEDGNKGCKSCQKR